MGILLNKSKNYVINGAMDFWQRGTSFAAVANGIYTADRWQYTKVGTMVHTVSRSTDIPTGSLAQYSTFLDVTTAQAVIAAGDRMTIRQKIEGLIFAPLRGKTQVLKFKVKATKVGIYCISFRNSAEDRSLVKEYTVNTTNTWETKEISFTHDETGTWLYDTSVGLSVTFTIASGTTFQTTANTWQTGNYIATSNQVNGVDNLANDFRITEVQLEEGQSASNFERAGGNTINELLLCQRYYCYLYLTRRRIVSSIMFDGCELPAPMRAMPVLAAGSTISDNGTLVLNATTPSVVGYFQTAYLNGTVAATTGGVHSVEPKFDAEL
jgi:hypothetical protein